MILDSLAIEQYRGFVSRIEIPFDPRLTVLVGENGVGKTSVLWAIRVLLSVGLPRLTGMPLKVLRFQQEDISRGWPYLRAQTRVLLLAASSNAMTCTVQKNAADFIPSTDIDGKPREHAVNTPDTYEVDFGGREPWSAYDQSNAPLVVYYSAHRSLALDRGPSKTRSGGGARAAYAGALDDRELRLGEMALLWRAEAALEQSDRLPARANRAIELALPVFLGEFQNLRVVGDDKPRLVVDKRGTPLDLSQLSDGERGLLALLIDLTRRLAQANPSLDDPARDGSAIVLIDELDLHMHPSWQRQIASKLVTTFPNCQFIATTHSPQVISELQPENLLLLRQKGDRVIPERCGQAYGLSVNDVLEYIMGTPSRAEPAVAAIHVVEDALEIGDLGVARLRLEELRALLRGDDPVVVGLEATINNLEALADETDTEELRTA